VNVLFVCTGNVSRSPAAEAVFRGLTGGAHATRSAGVSPFCPRPLGGEDLAWADLVAVMEADHRAWIVLRWPEAAAKVRVLEVEDRYHRHDPRLARLLEERLGALLWEIEAGGMIGT
jgi:predicted protein tyrosine phosphatase